MNWKQLLGLAGILLVMFISAAKGQDYEMATLMENYKPATAGVPDFLPYFVAYEVKYEEAECIETCTQRIFDNMVLEVCFKCDEMVKICRYFESEGLSECSYYFKAKR